jgi:HD-like signal output (HDOD) protein
MLADGKQSELLLPVADPGRGPGGSLPISLQVSELALPPAMADAVLLLRLLLSSHIADLHAITDVIRNDVGLTVQLFRLAALERGGRAASTLNVADLIVQIGLDKLKRLAAETGLNPLYPRNAAPQARERFWMHARLTARICQELAGETAPANREGAYAAGLLHNLGALPELIGWKVPEWVPNSVGEIGYYVASAWQLPVILVDVIHGDDNACHSQKAHSLLRLAKVADERALRWESAGIRLHSTCACS